MKEPARGSVILLFGSTGTAYQRFFNGGRWHGVNGKIYAWSQLLDMGPITVIHEVKEEDL